MQIQSYEFGNIVIDKKQYTSDVIIYPDRIRSNWWRKEGHQLHIDDIKEVIEFKPEVIVIGTGAYGTMRVLSETEQEIKRQNIELIILSTDKAYKKYNELIAENKKVVGCFHLTC